MLHLENALDIFRSIVSPWYESLKDPQESQKQVLLRLNKEYAKTRYGVDHQALDVRDFPSYRANFPSLTYRDLSPYLAKINEGDYSAILPEPLLCWVMTRGTTGPAKVLPVTKTQIEQIFKCGARALANHALRHKDSGLLSGRILNLNFPSNVHSMVINGHTVTYGYSSGTYAKLNPMLDKIGLLPRQEDLDALGAGISKHDWEKRFELVYQQAINEDVAAVMGVTPVILAFAKYVEREHNKKPKELWNMRALFCTSVRKIQSKYAPILRKQFGQVPVVEIYSATEGVFAQQLDDLPYVTPNYDQYFFEVETSHGAEMLCDLKRGEWGRLIVSSCMFPRYDIGDMVEAAGKNYFRVFGRHSALTILEHRLYRLSFGWLI